MISSITQQWIQLEAKNLAVSMLRWIQRFRFKRGVKLGQVTTDHTTEFRNFVTPYNFWMIELSASNWWAVKQILARFKFDMHIEDGPLLRMDHKMTLSGRGRGNVTLFPKFAAP